MEAHTPSRRSWHRWLGWSLLAVIAIFLTIGGWILYVSVSTALQAERNLGATLFTIHLVEQFVHDTGHWPNSWAELEEIRFPGDTPSRLNGEKPFFKWPDNAPYIRQCVKIDFDVNLTVVATQNPMTFTAIKPIGPFYEYRDYGDIKVLQETLQDAIITSDQQDNNH